MEIKIQDIIQIIQSVGFPVVVAGWLLWRTDKRLDEMLRVLHEIAVSVKQRD